MIHTRRQQIEEMRETHRVNCWGATLYVLGLSDKLAWLDRDTMEPQLQTFKKIPKQRVRIGDIVVWRTHWLEHTAIYLGDGVVWHKPGSCAATIETIEAINARNACIYGRVTEYRRAS